MQKRSFILVAAVGIVILLTLAAMSSIGGSLVVKEGDYILYGVSADSNSFHHTGTASVSIANVTSFSYDKATEFSVSGISILATTEHIETLTALTTMNDLGVKSQSFQKLNTTFGQKLVNVYQKNDPGQQVTSWAGTDPLVQYKMIIMQDGLTMTLTMQSTNIGQVMTGNNYSDWRWQTLSLIL